MLPLPGPLKPGGRKSPFPDPSDTKRRRTSDSPRPPFSSSNTMTNPRGHVLHSFPVTPGTPLERHLHPPAMDLTYQPSGPDQDANRLLGYSPPYSDQRPANHFLPYHLIWGDADRHDEINEPFQQRQTSTPSPVITRVINPGQQPTPPQSDPFRTPRTAISMPSQWTVHQQPTPPKSNPRGVSQADHKGPSQLEPKGTPQTPLPIRPRQFKVPQRELLVQLVEFEELAAHTAKCDVCDKRNTDGMVRCKPCGWQCCRRCLAERSGDRTHPKAGNLHVPDDTPRANISNVQIQNSSTPSTGKQRSIRAQRMATPHASPEEEAAWILLNLKNDKRNPGGASRTAGQVDGPSQQPNRALDDDLAIDRDGTELMPDMSSEGETEDGEDLPDNLVNVRRNPSRRARPADMKE